MFDSPTSPPRLLKHRSGHHAPPHLIRYYGDDGKQLLTAARDRSLRCTSVVRDSRSFELSQGSVAKKATNLSIPVTSLKFSPITSMSYSSARSKDWDDVITAHSEDPFARSWTMQNKRVGNHTFRFTAEDEKKKVNVGAVKVEKQSTTLSLFLTVIRRVSASPLVGTFALGARQQVSSICGTCNLEFGEERFQLGPVPPKFRPNCGRCHLALNRGQNNETLRVWLRIH